MAADFELGKVWYQPPPWHGEGWPHASRWEWRDWEWWLQQWGLPAATIERYRQHREHWAVRTRDTKTGAERVWFYPTPMQVLGHQATEPFVLLGGARGGGKSAFLRWEAHRRCLAVPGYQAIIFRRQLEELKLYHIKRARREVLQLTGGKGRAVGDDYIEYGNGSMLHWGHAKDEGDEEKYLGSEWDFIGIDQMEQFLPSQLTDIFAAGRSAEIPGVTSVVRGTANPGGPDPQWIIDRFITKSPPDDDSALGYDAAEWRYIPARVYDNPYLMDRDGSFRRYEGRLSMYGPVRRRQMLLGDWGAREGQFFPELQEHHHKRRLDFIPPGTRLYAGLDYGYNKPFAVVFAVMGYDGRLAVIGDLKGTYTPLFASARGHGETQAEFLARSEKTVAGLVHKWTRDKGLTLYKLWCDPDLDKHKTGVETGVQGLKRAKLPVAAADNTRYLGWLRLRAWFLDAPDKLPWCIISPDAAYTWRSLTTIVCDKDDPDDVDTDGDDHGADALRYLVMGMPAPDTATAPPADHPKGSVGDLIRRQQRKGRKRQAAIV